jgi:hypothetical protein
VARRYEQALTAFNLASSSPVWVLVHRAACHALLDEMDRARDYVAEALHRAPDLLCGQGVVQAYRGYGAPDQRNAGSRATRIDHHSLRWSNAPADRPRPPSYGP